MSEKKTFKNPDLTVFNDGSGWKITLPGVTAYSGSHLWFHSNEWDIEVTFTKKVKPPRVGDIAMSPSGISECEIAAIDGDEVWLRYSDGSHSTIDLDKLIYAS